MIKKTIRYTDFDGNERVEDFYFNLTKPEAIEYYVADVGGLDKVIEKVVQTRDNKRIIEIFKDLIQRSYGEKSADGRRFIKSKELTESFMQTEAYTELFMELSSDSTAAAAFINGIVPQISSKGNTIPAPPNH